MLGWRRPRSRHPWLVKLNRVLAFQLGLDPGGAGRRRKVSRCWPANRAAAGFEPISVALRRPPVRQPRAAARRWPRHPAGRGDRSTTPAPQRQVAKDLEVAHRFHAGGDGRAEAGSRRCASRPSGEAMASARTSRPSALGHCGGHDRRRADLGVIGELPSMPWRRAVASSQVRAWPFQRLARRARGGYRSAAPAKA